MPTLLPIALAAPPEEINIDPKDKIEKLMVKNCDGRKVIGLTYPDGSEPEVEMKFQGAVMEFESLLHGRVVASATGATEVMAIAEFNSASLPAARPTGTIGNSVVAQVEGESKAIASYIDPLTKLARKIAIKDTTDTLVGDQISIAAGMVFAVSPELAAKAVDITAWVPCSVASATVVTAEPLGLLTIFAQGIDFDGNARSITIWNASRTDSAPISDKPERAVKLSILQSVLSTSGLGFDMVSVPLKNAC